MHPDQPYYGSPQQQPGPPPARHPEPPAPAGAVYGAPARTPPAKKKAPTWFVITFVLVIAAICTGVGIAVVNGTGESEDPVEADRSTTAEVMCEQFIEDRLRAPASAEFPRPTTVKTGAQYRVTGSVDSQNGFGAMIRSDYVCVVRDEADDNWTLVDLQLSE